MADASHVEQSSSDTDRQKVWDLIKDIRVAMMVTQDASHVLSARPMSAAQTDYDGTLWFMAREGSPKLAEIEGETDVLLAYSHPSKQDYVSIAGRARVVRDRAKVRELWSEPARVWFPKGPEDASIALIAVTVTTAEYWDAPSATMVYAYGYAKARLTGKSPELGENKRVNF